MASPPDAPLQFEQLQVRGGTHRARGSVCRGGGNAHSQPPHPRPPPPHSRSAVEPEFWEALGAKKLDEWKLSEAPVEIQGE